jgi:pimeloyl-ACP methyl ester carboxylesterase
MSSDGYESPEEGSAMSRQRIAEAASARYGWPLHVVEDAGHFVAEQPEAFRRALQAALGETVGR